MIEQAELERRVETALRTKADHLRVRTGPFVEGPAERLELTSPSPRRRHRRAWAVAALATAACLALWWRLSSGPIELDMATPWLKAAIDPADRWA